MRTRWAVGVIAGIILGLGAVMAIEASTDDASAQSGFTVTPAQLQINQKISQAAVRRSNRSLNYLAPIRTSQTDAADSGNDGVKPLSQITGSGQGWTSSQIADGAITTSKVGNGAVTESKLSAELLNKLPKWAVVNSDGNLIRGSSGVTSTRINAGNYRVDFGTNISQCSWTAMQVEFTAANIGFVGAELDVTDNERVAVRTTDQAGATADRIFSIQVNC